jgi:N-dimethylarginine dimethylaminohydrolase
MSLRMEDAAPSSLGGPGWQSRAASHAEDVADGTFWRPCGYLDEVAPLREVVLAVPPAAMPAGDDPRAHLFDAFPDAARLGEQAAGVAGRFRELGITVHLAVPSSSPNYLFQRDLFACVGHEGAILGRPASRQRAGEERYTGETLARLGVPILRTLTGDATFEGADLLRPRADLALLGMGLRTNARGAEQVMGTHRDLGVACVAVPVSGASQHLLGDVVFIDRDLCALNEHASPELRGVLADAGIRCLVVPGDDELRARRGMNFVTLAPRQVLMPAGCPRLRARLADEGCTVHEADVSEYLRAAGGLGCLTGILRRGER